MTEYNRILDIAQEHLGTIPRTLRCWAVELHGGKPTLMSYWRGDNNRVEAKALFVDKAESVDLDLIVAHLNEMNGSGPELLKVLRSMYQQDVAARTNTFTPAMVHKVTTRAIN